MKRNYRIAFEARDGGVQVLPERNGRRAGRSVFGQLNDGLEHGGGIDGLESGGAGARESEEVGDQVVEAPGFLGDDLHALGVLLLELRITLQNAGGSRDAGQGIADLVGQAGRELSQGKQALGALHALEIVLQLAIDLGQAVGGAFQLRALFAAALGQNAGEDTGGTEEGNFPELIDGVVLRREPGGPVVGSVGEAGEQSGGQATEPTEAEAGKHDGQIVEVLRGVVPSAAGKPESPGGVGLINAMAAQTAAMRQNFVLPLDEHVVVRAGRVKHQSNAAGGGAQQHRRRKRQWLPACY